MADIIMCQACAAQGTVKKQYGYRVIDEQCETCAGEGVVKKGLAKKASDELMRLAALTAWLLFPAPGSSIQVRAGLMWTATGERFSRYMSNHGSLM